MGACTCGYSTDEEKNCNGTHKVVKAVKADLAEKLEANGFPHAAEYGIEVGTQQEVSGTIIMVTAI